MNVLGFLLALSNLKDIGGPTQQLKDVSLKVDNVASLRDSLNNRGISIEKFRTTGYQRMETVGVYASETLRNYLFRGNVSPDEESFILWLFFEPRTDSNEFESDEHLYYLIGRPGLDEQKAKAFLEYINDTHRKKRTVVENN